MNKPYYLFHPSFIFRTPLITLRTSPVSQQEFFELTKQPFFKEAIYLASPILYDKLIKWHHKELTEAKEIQKLVISLYKYYTRTQSRCTPYGLFAACATGAWNNTSKIVLNNPMKRHTRLDMNYLCALTQQLNTHHVILPLLRFYPNNSLYNLGDTIRYVEYKYVNNRRIHQISSVTTSDYLQQVLHHSEQGASIHSLIKLLMEEENTYEEAEDFIKDLISNQLLVSELEPAVTGEEFIHQVIRSLKKINTNKHKEITSIIQTLETVQDLITSLDQKIGNDIDSYRNIYHRLQILGASIEENQLFQTDLYKKGATASLNQNIQKQLLDVICFLNKFSLRDENFNLKIFKENFYKQYEDSEIPLLEALDTETGVGYTGKDLSGINPFLDDVLIPQTETNVSNIQWNKQQQFLQEQLIKATKSGAYSVLLTDEDIKDFDTPSAILPDTLSIMFRVIDNNKIYLQSCGGSSAANLLGRFAHGDLTIHKVVSDITAHEQKHQNNKILAEIVHLPESRIGNILLRPTLRNYEIPYLAKSAMPLENQIALQDLMISIKNNKIILRSKRLNKEIIPRLSTAHNYSFNALPVYQFLCDLQTQYYEKQGLDFNWGKWSLSYQFLPRVEYNHIILVRAKWQLTKFDFQVLLEEKNPDYLNNITSWRNQLNIPKHVVLVESDNELLVNFEDELSIKAFVSNIKKMHTILLEEFLFDADQLLVKDMIGNGYTNEFIAIALKPFISTNSSNPEEKESPKNNLPNILTKTISRSFNVGTEWLYYKFYCGVKTSDKILSDVIKPLVNKLIEQKEIDQFFFIRYTDPELHIRLRLHINDVTKLGKIISTIGQFIQPYVSHGLITKVQTDTYRRELERYGINSIEIAESIFFVDSQVTLHLLDLIDGEEGEEIKWLFAIRSVDELLDYFKLTTDKKLDLLEHLKNAFTQEHSTSKELKLQLDTKFRKVRKQVENILDRQLDANREISPVTDLLKWKSQHIQPLADQILDLQNKQELYIPIVDLIASYSHMMINRIFKARQRTYEMLIYHLLYRYHQSLVGLKKSKIKQLPSWSEL